MKRFVHVLMSTALAAGAALAQVPDAQDNHLNHQWQFIGTSIDKPKPEVSQLFIGKDTIARKGDIISFWSKQLTPINPKLEILDLSKIEVTQVSGRCKFRILAVRAYQNGEMFAYADKETPPTDWAFAVPDSPAEKFCRFFFPPEKSSKRSPRPK